MVRVTTDVRDWLVTVKGSCSNVEPSADAAIERLRGGNSAAFLGDDVLMASRVPSLAMAPATR